MPDYITRSWKSLGHMGKLLDLIFHSDTEVSDDFLYISFLESAQPVSSHLGSIQPVTTKLLRIYLNKTVVLASGAWLVFIFVFKNCFLEARGLVARWEGV